MSDQEWVVAVVLVVVVAAAAYMAGRRKAVEPSPMAQPETSPPSETPTSSSKAPPVSPRVPSMPPPLPAAARNSKPSPSTSAAPLPSAAPKPKVEEKPPLARLDYEEDEDIDPTRIGAASKGPPQAPVRTIYQPPIHRVVYDPEAGEAESPGAASLFLVHATAQTDKGLRRKRNEDSVLVEDAANLFVVADGMGGYRGGELASSLAVKTIGDAFRTATFEGPPHDGVAKDATELARAIQMANASILEIASKKKELEGMGTTVCSARFSPGKQRLYIGHVGDSRCYRLRDGVFKQMTADHTMADFGMKGPESQHLSRAVGIWPTVPIDIVMGVPAVGDVYLLCSDGLTKMLTDDIIGNVLRNEEDPKVAVARLIFFANARGGKDNITVVLVRVVPPDWAPRPSADPPPSLPPPIGSAPPPSGA